MVVPYAALVDRFDVVDFEDGEPAADLAAQPPVVRPLDPFIDGRSTRPATADDREIYGDDSSR